MTKLTLINRTASVLVVALYGGLVLLAGAPAREVCEVLLYCMAPLALIWFGEFFGSLTGSFGSSYIDEKTPGVLVAFMGWFILVGFPILMIFLLPKHSAS